MRSFVFFMAVALFLVAVLGFSTPANAQGMFSQSSSFQSSQSSSTSSGFAGAEAVPVQPSVGFFAVPQPVIFAPQPLLFASSGFGLGFGGFHSTFGFGPGFGSSVFVNRGFFGRSGVNVNVGIGGGFGGNRVVVRRGLFGRTVVRVR